MAHAIGRPLWAEIADLLRSEIDQQRLQPGERLREAELADRFGVSRGPIREALVELERIGLVQITPRRGAYVATLTLEDVDELYELRTALEVVALDGVLRRSSKTEISAMVESLERLDRAGQEGDGYGAITADLDFHHGLCRLSGNRRLLRAWETHLDQFRLIIGAVQNDDRWQTRARVEEHQAVLDALLCDDLDAARTSLRTHLNNAREVMISVVTERSHPSAAERPSPAIH